MSASYQHRASSRSNQSRGSRTSDGQRPAFASQAVDLDRELFLDPCAATASFFLFAQGKEIVCLHHDTLQVERRFQKHKEDVLVIAADNVSERGSGRQVVSYDSGLTAIVWDLYTGEEISCFSSYEKIKVAAFMRDGNIAFGNEKGNIILFEPGTSEHVSARTIFDPVTALAPSTDLRTFAIGYQNGSILIANIKPTFNVLHTLTTQRGPSPVTGLAWHGSSSRQRSDMLATQTAEGDLRVWSVPKSPTGEELPRCIRNLNHELSSINGRNWIAWSKSGRIIQHVDGESRSWDVRTKKVVKSVIPTVANVQGIANCGPTATLFTVGPNYMVQQYDINPEEPQMTMVANEHHPPTIPPPTPPDSIQDTRSGQPTPDLGRGAGALSPSPPPNPPSIDVESSEEEGGAMSPLQKIAQEMDAIEEERRDQVTPLSPISSHASRSSRSSYRRPRVRRRERSGTPDSDGTAFSADSPMATNLDNSSLLSVSSAGSAGAFNRHRRRTPSRESAGPRVDLFPHTRNRLHDVKFRTPKLPPGEISPDILRREMLSVIFGWDGDIDALIRDEHMRHRKGSDGAVLLGKWLGDLGADALSNTLGSESMSSSDWMFLALSSSMGGGDSGRKVGETFVQKLLSMDDVHRAVAVMLGLGDHLPAVDQYSSKGFDIEAVLLCCLTAPQNWPKISSLIRKWGENAVKSGDAELAVRCYACSGMEHSDSWDDSATSNSLAINTQIDPPLSPPTSPPSAGNPNRLTAKNASLKLITSFGDRGRLQSQKLGETPIAESALSQALSPGGGIGPRSRSKGTNRDPSTARTATPGGFLGGRRAASSQRSDIEATPRNNTMMSPRSERARAGSYEEMPNLAILNKPGEAFSEHRKGPKSIDATSQEMRLDLDPGKTKSERDARSARSGRSRSRARKEEHGSVSKAALEPGDASTTGELSPLMTDGSVKSYRARHIDRYIASLEQANNDWQVDSRPPTRNEQPRAPSRRSERSRSRARQSSNSHMSNVSEGRARSETRQIPPSKRSPSSPVPMVRGDTAGTFKEYDDERYYGVTSPVDDAPKPLSIDAEQKKQQHLSTESKGSLESIPRPDSRRSSSRPGRETIGDRARARSSSRKAEARRGISPDRASVRSTNSRRPHMNRSISEQDVGGGEMQSPASSKYGMFSTKESAQKELEERRASFLARRPSVPTIPMPGQPDMGRPMSSRDNKLSPGAGATFLITEEPEFRSQTVDPAEMMRFAPKIGVSTPSVPIGLPSTPRAMKHVSYSAQNAEENYSIPAVPALPNNLETLQPITYGQNLADNESSTLLPSTVYQAAQRRSSSAPPDQAQNRPRRSSLTSRAHGRKSSKFQSSDRNSDEPIPIVEENEKLEERDYDPPVVPELQHLNSPPPPPPPPTMALPKLSTSSLGPAPASYPVSAGPTMSSGVINIAIDGGGGGNSSRTTTPATQASHGSAATSPSSHRRGQSGNDGFSGKFRSMAERIRSSSKGRNKQAAPQDAGSPQNRSPYETMLPGATYFPAVQPHADNGHMTNSVVPGYPSSTPPVNDRSSPAVRGNTAYGYRNPKEIRAALNSANGNRDSMTGGMF